MLSSLLSLLKVFSSSGLVKISANWLWVVGDLFSNAMN
jgi:hypothetical protein